MKKLLMITTALFALSTPFALANDDDTMYETTNDGDQLGGVKPDDGNDEYDDGSDVLKSGHSDDDNHGTAFGTAFIDHDAGSIDDDVDGGKDFSDDGGKDTNDPDAIRGDDNDNDHIDFHDDSGKDIDISGDDIDHDIDFGGSGGSNGNSYNQ